MEGPLPALSRRWREWRAFVVLVAVMLLFRSAVADWNLVPSGSMLPSILIGDRILVDKLACGVRVPFTLRWLVRWGDPTRGDVVTFEAPDDGRLLVKRIIGLPGDVVALTGNRLAINGVPAVYEPLAGADTSAGEAAGRSAGAAAGYATYRERLLGNEWPIRVRDRGGDPDLHGFAPVRVPAGHYLLLGDNRDHSRDSRAIGFIARERILGKVTRVAFSLDYENHYLPRADRFLTNLP